MSDIKTSVLEVNTGGAITNIKDFKQHIEDLKGTLLGLEKGTEEYNTVAKELQDSQQKLNEVMDVAKGKGEAVTGSYDNLVATMRQLKKEWRATGDEIERKQLGEKILNINNQLKKLDASTGNFQRNVGNYSEAFSGAFANLSKGIGSAIPSVKGLSSAFKALLANPIVAVIAAIVLVIKNLIDAIKGSEEQTNRLKVATAGLQLVMDAVKNVISAVAGVIVTLTEKISNLIQNGLVKLSSALSNLGFNKLAEDIDKVNSKLEYYKLLQQEEIDLVEQRRLSEVKLAQNQNKISELRAKLADKEKYSLEERIELVKEWEAAELNAAETIRKLARDEYVTLYKKIQLTETSKEEAEALHQAELKLIHAEGEYSERVRKVNKEKSTLLATEKRLNNANSEKNKLLSEQAKLEEEALKAIEKVYEEEEKQVNSIIERLINNSKSEIDILTEKYNEERVLLEKFGEDVTELTAEYQKKVNEILTKELVKKTKENIELIQDEYENVKVKVDFEYDYDLATSKAKLEGGLKGLFKDFNVFPDIFSTDDIDKALQRVLDYNNEVLRITKEKNEKIIEENQKLIDSLPDGEESNQARLDALKAISDAQMAINDAETENILSNIEAQETAEEQQAERRNARLEMYKEGLSSVVSILNSVTQYQQKQIQEEYKDGKISEEVAKKRFEDTKKMQVASAIINMAAGVVSAIATAQQLGPIAGPIMAAVNSAAVIAAGAVQIANIKKTKFGDSSASVSTPNVAQITNEYTPEYTQNITAETELTELSNAINSKPLFVSVTDIDNVQTTVIEREQESTY